MQADKTQTESPIGMAMVICDQIITEENTEKKTLVGTFNRIHASEIPFPLPTMSVFVSLTNGKGEIPIRLRCVSQETGEEVFQINGKVTFPNLLHVHELVFNLKNVHFPHYGTYSFDLESEGQFLLGARVHVQESK